LSAVFDEVTVKERLVVEGGNSGTVLSQFDGPVTFNKEVKFAGAVNAKSQLKVSSDTQSTTTANGALIVSGGVGIAKNLNVGGTTTLTGLLNANGGASITGTLGVSGATTLSSSLGVNGTSTLSNLSVTGIATISGAEGITSPKFKATIPQIVTLNGTPTYKMFRSDGTQDFITSREVTTALGYTPADSASITGDFPLGNSVVCADISDSFNGTTAVDFTLLIGATPFIPAGSSANLIVSIGGVIQRPGADFSIVTSGGQNTSTIRFTSPPPAGASCFIVALGGQGSLVSNVDWDTKGQILVATGNNAAARLAVGSNGYVLTADSAQAAGVKWAVATPVGSVFYMAASSADTATGGSVTISGTTYHAPEGYLICSHISNNGVIPTSGTFQGVDAGLLENLLIFLGSTYGIVGRVPNLIDNFAGYSAVPGTIGGSATVTLNTTQMPSHSHGGITNTQTANHRHVMPGDDFLSNATGGAGWEGISVGGFNYDARSTSGNGQYWLTGYNDASHQHGVFAEGGNQPHQNLPPYVGMLPVIKY
jgi:microcystin-dependent protein